METRILVTGAGSGASGNLIRGLRAMKPDPYIVGVNDDRFTLKQSLADRNYLAPSPTAPAFIEATIKLVRSERINVVMATDDQAVKVLSDHREQFPIDLFVPSREAIDRCQDKHALSAFLRARDIPAPLTCAVTSLDDLDEIFERLPRQRLTWCRLRRGSRSLGATAVTNAAQARTWISQWQELQGVAPSEFTLSEYLPGRHLILQGVWRDGRLLLAQTVEVLSYFAAGNNPTGVFSLPSLAKTIYAPQVLDVSAKAVGFVDDRASGAFIIELREATSGVPSITEINAGRFPAGITALLATGRRNMIELFVRAAMGEPIAVDDPYEPGPEYYLVRDIDTLPGVFSVADLIQGASLVPAAASS